MNDRKIDCYPLNPFGLVIKPNVDSIWDIDVESLYDLVLNNKLLIIKSLGYLDRESLVKYCERWGQVIEWNFGKVFDLYVDKNPTNYLVTNSRVTFHWDGAFIDSPPNFDLFQCIKSPKDLSGGETLFANTNLLWNDLTREEREKWKQIEITYTTSSISAHYGGTIIEPLVSKHPLTGESRLRFGEPLDDDVQHLTSLNMKVHGIDEPELFINKLTRMLYQECYCYSHEWEDRDIVIFDNNTLLHARNKFSQNSPRHIQRVHII